MQGRYQQSSAAAQSTPALWCRAHSPELCSPIISGDPIRSRREELLSCSGCASISGVKFSRSFSILRYRWLADPPPAVLFVVPFPRSSGQDSRGSRSDSQLPGQALIFSLSSNWFSSSSRIVQRSCSSICNHSLLFDSSR